MEKEITPEKYLILTDFYEAKGFAKVLGYRLPDTINSIEDCTDQKSPFFEYIRYLIEKFNSDKIETYRNKHRNKIKANFSEKQILLIDNYGEIVDLIIETCQMIQNDTWSPLVKKIFRSSLNENIKRVAVILIESDLFLNKEDSVNFSWTTALSRAIAETFSKHNLTKEKNIDEIIQITEYTVGTRELIDSPRMRGAILIVYLIERMFCIYEFEIGNKLMNFYKYQNS